MRMTSHTRVLLMTAALLMPASQMPAQPPGPGAAPNGQGRGARVPRDGQNGFGRMGQPVQGVVTASSPGKITIRTTAGDVYDVTLGENGRAMKDRQPIQLSDIKPGDSVTAMGQVDAEKKSVQAMMVMDIDAATAAKAQENLGKTYIVGRITAIDVDNLKLTITRQDGVSQVIAVDEGTSFQRGMRGVAADLQAAGAMGAGFAGRGGGAGGQGGPGGAGGPGGRPGTGQQQPAAAPESITLADVKVGDTIAATGSVKTGSFTAQKMGVMEAGAGGRNRPMGPDGTPANARDTPPQR